MLHREFKLKEINIRFPSTFKEEINEVQLLAGEAGLVSNSIILPNDINISPDMYIQIKKRRTPVKEFSVFSNEVQQKAEKMLKEFKITRKKERVEIVNKLNALEKELSISDEKENVLINHLEEIIKATAEQNKEDDFFRQLQKHHKGLCECISIKDVSFLTEEGIKKANNLIEVQLLHQTEFKERINNIEP